MRLVKLKNVPNKEETIARLISLLKQSESPQSPLVEDINHPNQHFYVVIKDDVVVPAYILVKDDEALVLWVHRDFRNNGYGKFMVQNMNIRYVTALPSSVSFWKQIGFRTTHGMRDSGPIRMKIQI